LSPNNYGRAYASIFHRSMSGKGALVIAVWTYSFSHAYPAVEAGFGTVGHVELNPKIMAVLIGGCTVKEVSEVIDFLCSPDEESESKKDEGRRLVRLSQFKYRVVNFMEYREKASDSPEAVKKRERQEKYLLNKKGSTGNNLRNRPENIEECVALAATVGWTESEARAWYADMEASNWAKVDGTPFRNWPREMAMARDRARERDAKLGVEPPREPKWFEAPGNAETDKKVFDEIRKQFGETPSA
jgi:hypothetical protein